VTSAINTTWYSLLERRCGRSCLLPRHLTDHHWWWLLLWLDRWLGSSTLSERYPALFSHSTRRNASVAFVFSHVLTHIIIPRFSCIATLEVSAPSVELTLVAPLKWNTTRPRTGWFSSRVQSQLLEIFSALHAGQSRATSEKLKWGDTLKARQSLSPALLDIEADMWPKWKSSSTPGGWWNLYPLIHERYNSLYGTWS
jgi:hypothetical protein